jgi:serine/threonine protein kinase
MLFSNLSNGPRPDRFVQLRPWGLYDSERCRTAFTCAYELYLDVERELDEKDSVIRTRDDVARRLKVNADTREVHQVLWILQHAFGGTWSETAISGEWRAEFSVGRLDYPTPSLEGLLLSRYVGAPPSAISTVGPMPMTIANDETIRTLAGQATVPDLRVQQDVPVDNRFRVRHKLGDGAFGAVWQADDLLLRRLVALKFVHANAPGAVDALMHARALARVQHPNIVTVYEVAANVIDPTTAAPATAIVMEFVQGPTLEEQFLQPPPSDNFVQEAGAALVDAVGAYHAANLAHTDLHDCNVLVGPAGIKVLDPLYQETTVLQSTARRQALQARDLRNLRDLLTRLLRWASVPQDKILRFDMKATNADAGTLRSAFAEAFDTSATTTHAPAVTEPRPPTVESTSLLAAPSPSIKALLLDPRQEIALHDRVVAEVQRVVAAIDDSRMPVSGSVPLHAATLRERLRQYEVAASELRDMLILGCYWGNTQQSRLWVGALERLAKRPETGGVNGWIELRRFPALLIFYAGGLAALARPNYDSLRGILLEARSPEGKPGNNELSRRLYPAAVINHDAGRALLQGMERRYTPLNDYLHDILREPLRDLLPDESAYDETFVRFEYIGAVLNAERALARGTSAPRVPLGRFAWQRSPEGDPPPIRRLLEEAEWEGTEWPLLRYGIFSSREGFKEAQEAVAANVAAAGWW